MLLRSLNPIAYSIHPLKHTLGMAFQKFYTMFVADNNISLCSFVYLSLSTTYINVHMSAAFLAASY